MNLGNREGTYVEAVIFAAKAVEEKMSIYLSCMVSVCILSYTTAIQARCTGSSETVVPVV